jgi:apolipoprotein D and lipocalin family protein
MIRSISILSFLALFIMGCNAQQDSLISVKEVDLNRYAGIWYEIASYPQRFQKGCRCTTAEYQLTGKSYIKVINKCQKPGKFAKIEGKAFPVKGSENTKLKVQFFWPFKADYWIIDLDPDYKWAVVSNGSKKYLWILARRPFLDEEIYQKIIQKLQLKGFDTTQLKKTAQDCK